MKKRIRWKDGCKCFSFLLHNKQRGECDHCQDMQRQRRDEEKEISVILLSYTVIHPRTMVVKYLQSKREKKNESHALATKKKQHSKSLQRPYAGL